MKPTPPTAPPTAPSDDTLQAWLRASRQLEDAPEALIQRVIALGPQAGAATSTAGPVPALARRVRRLLATLVHDLTPQPAMALGLRSAALTPRRVLCSAEGCDVDLQITPAPPGRQGWMLHGQVLGDWPASEAAPQVRVLDPAGGSATAAQPLDELAEFRCGPLPDGHWVLQIDGGDWLIELPPLTLAAADGAKPEA